MYSMIAIGCPTTQNEIQKMTLPSELFGYLRPKALVSPTSGIWPSMPKKLHGLTMWKGTDTRTSCITADRRKTTKVAAGLEIFRLRQGKYTCLISQK